MKIVIVDTGCANLFSIHNIIRKIGYTSTISDDTTIISQSDKIFLPGVGSAQCAMKKLKEKKLINLLKNITQPTLGICLGMQILTKYSEENKGVKTLGIIDTKVKQIPYTGLSLPHIGWNTTIIKNKHFLFHNIKNNSHFYFIHSYYIPLCKETIAHTKYGQLFTAAIHYHNFFGVQFHPEKSGIAGQQLIKNFLEL